MFFSENTSAPINVLIQGPNHTSNHTETWEVIVFASCGLFSLLAILMACFLIYRHLKHWTEPKPQTYIVRILIMVPIYSIDSWLSIYFRHYSLYFDIARDAYEAYVLYQFFELLCWYFQSECKKYYGEEFAHISVGEILANFPPQPHPWPCNFIFPKIIPGPMYLLKSRRFMFQFVILKPLCAILACILHIFDLYRPGSFSPKYGYLWISLVLNVSVTLALYWLLIFYQIIEDIIHDYKPLWKLLAIKAILFFAFWQSVAIGFLSYMNVIPPIGSWDEDEVAEGITNVVICVEMFILSVVHIWTFPYDEYRAGRGTHTLLNTWSNVISRVTLDVFNQADVLQEARNAFSPEAKAHQKAVDKKLTEKTRLLEKGHKKDRTEYVELDPL